MQTSSLTPRQYWQEVKSNPNRARFGSGEKAALINIDLQRAYTDIECFPTASSTPMWNPSRRWRTGWRTIPVARPSDRRAASVSED